MQRTTGITGIQRPTIVFNGTNSTLIGSGTLSVSANIEMFFALRQNYTGDSRNGGIITATDFFGSSGQNHFGRTGLSEWYDSFFSTSRPIMNVRTFNSTTSTYSQTSTAVGVGSNINYVGAVRHTGTSGIRAVLNHSKTDNTYKGHIYAGHTSNNPDFIATSIE